MAQILISTENTPLIETERIGEVAQVLSDSYVVSSAEKSMFTVVSTDMDAATLSEVLPQIDKSVELIQNKIALGASADEVRFMPEKLVSVDTANPLDIKTYIEPKIEFDKWTVNGVAENTLSLSIPSIEGYTDKTVDSVTGEVVMRNKTEGFYFRKPTDSNDIVKFGLILYETPKNTQTWEFKLEGWEQFDFFYQGELSAVDISQGCHRQENVIGSYAVYHKEKKHHILGKMDYGIGKFCHIYRPRLLDANGTFLGWIDLNIEDGIYKLSIENIPQEVLDKAILPLKFNDTFGNTTTGASDISTADLAIAHHETTTTEAGTVTQLNIYVLWAGGTSDVRLGMYSDDAGNNRPNTLLASAVVISGVNSTGLKTVSYSTTISASTKYWFAHENDTTGIGIAYDNTGVYTRDAYKFVTNTLPSPWGESGNNQRRLTMYCTYTASGGTPSPVYTKEILDSLPNNTDNLSTEFTEQEYTNVTADDGSYVELK